MKMFLVFLSLIALVAGEDFVVYVSPDLSSTSPDTNTPDASPTSSAWIGKMMVPSELTVSTGDSIIFTTQTTSHVIAYTGNMIKDPIELVGAKIFLSTLYNPTGFPLEFNATVDVSSGPINPSSTWKVTIDATAKAGWYLFYSVASPTNTINITVAASKPKTASQVASDSAAWMASKKTSLSSEGQTTGTYAADSADPTLCVYNMPAGHTVGGFPNPSYSYFRFNPWTVNIKVNDKIKFTTADFELHAVYLNGTGDYYDSITDYDPTAGRLILKNSLVAPNIGVADITKTMTTATSVVVCGFLSNPYAPALSAGVPNTVTCTVQFKAPGTFKVIDLMHEQYNFKGKIVVSTTTTTGCPGTTTSSTATNAASFIQPVVALVFVLILAVISFL